MSESVIKDGTGSGHRAMVDSQNRIHTQSLGLSYAQHAADRGVAAYMALTSVEMNSTDTEHFVMAIENSDLAKHFHVDRMLVGWNGGNTNFNRPLHVTLNAGGPPVANFVSGTPLNPNSGSAANLNISSWHWDEVGNGMTMSAAAPVFDGYLAQGYTEFSPYGGFIMVPGVIFSVSIMGPEVGKFTLLVTGWFENDLTNIT